MWLRNISLGSVILSTLIPISFAQESHSEFSIQGTGFFTKSTSQNAYTYRPTNTGGFLIAYRYRFHRRLSAELVDGFNRDTQKFSSRGVTLGTPSNDHQATAALVEALPSFRKGSLRPYILAGGGALVFSPSGNTLSRAQTQAKPAFVYGAGVNYALSKRTSLRFEYRGLVYSAPDLGFRGLNTNSITHSAQPAVGLTFHF